MRKSLWGLAALPLLAALATSCNDEIVEAKGGDQVLTFGVAAGKQTVSRAAEYDITNLEDDADGLLVKAYNGTALHKDFTLKYDYYAHSAYTSRWGYANMPDYHPEFPLTYYSVYPTSAATPASGGTFTYAVPTASQVDVLAATAGSNINDPEANLIYHHILTQVNFAIQGQDGLTIEVKDIQLIDVPSAGTYTIGTKTWGAPTASGTYTYPGSGTVASAAILHLTSDEKAPGKENTNALMLMPQTTALTGTLSFKYKISDSNGSLTAAPVDGEGFKTVAVDLSDIGGIEDWQAAKRYLYIFNFNMNYITFTVKVEEEWANAGETYYPDQPETSQP